MQSEAGLLSQRACVSECVCVCVCLVDAEKETGLLVWANSAMSEREGALSLFIYLPGREREREGERGREGRKEAWVSVCLSSRLAQRPLSHLLRSLPGKKMDSPGG